MIEGITESGAKGKTGGMLSGAKEALTGGSDDDDDDDDRGSRRRRPRRSLPRRAAANRSRD